MTSTSSVAAMPTADPIDPIDPGSYPNRRREIRISVDAHTLDHDRKEARVQQVEPPGATVTLVTDEPQSLGGDGTAPTPLQYYASSIAFCMMSHVNYYLRIRKVRVDDFRMQVTARFYMAGSALKGDVEAEALEFDTRIEIESPDSAEKVALALEYGERTCFVYRSLINPVVVNSTFALNGDDLALPDGA